MKTTNCYILGISAFYHDSSIALLKNGSLVFAAQEERYTRIKADASFPKKALRDCLQRNFINIDDIDLLIFYENPTKKYHRIVSDCINNTPNSLGSFLRGVYPWAKGKKDQAYFIQNEIKTALNLNSLTEIPPVFCTDHHLSHAASAFYPSPYYEAAILCIDGVGESETTSIWYGCGNKISKHFSIKYPHSLGLLYSAFTQYTGFKVNFGEYKLMGLAPYGKPIYAALIKENLITIHADGNYSLNLSYFSFRNGKKMINHRFEKLFNHKARKPESEITQHEMDIASSIQLVINEIILKLVNKIYRELNTANLCMAGGVALNCVTNGYIAEQSAFKNIWIQPAANDAGGALGAAYLGWHAYLQQERVPSSNADAMQGAYLGPYFLEHEIENYLNSVSAYYEKYTLDDLINETARLLAEGNVIGWFQGKMEFGPRALGNRSILGDPRSAKMQSIMNLKIKFRESFRPFAPSILAEYAQDYFNLTTASPYMLFVKKINTQYRIKMQDDHKHLFGLELLGLQRSIIPAVTHVDYSARVQTVHSETNPLYYQLIKAFHNLTQCPLLVNTSFNVRGEPIVCSPMNAYDCFMSTEMDYCAIGNFLLKKTKQPNKNRKVACSWLD